MPRLRMSRCWLVLIGLAYITITTSATQKFFGKSVSTTSDSHGKSWRESLHTSSGSNLSSMSPGYDVYDKGLFTPLEDLSILSETEFTHMNHPAFPRHNVRIKKTRFCDTTVNAYTGYIDIEARHLFFYFFESRGNPQRDDVIFWTSGGPGASSSLGLFMELGPCRISDSNGTKHHPESWNSNANVFFIDQPIGVGFSYADYGEEVKNTEEAAKDIAAFVSIFFENFSSFKGRPFHMAGESYGGRYIPLFAAEVYDQNARLMDAGLTPINLTSIMIGNGWTETSTMLSSYFDMQCTSASIAPVTDIASCVRMKQVVPRCQKWLKESCTDVSDAINCNAAVAFCTRELFEPYEATGKNPYDISKECIGELATTLCYTETKYIEEYLNRPEIRALIGTDPYPTNYTVVSLPVNIAFEMSQDGIQSSHHHVAALLERGVKALIYVGTYDWICNWIGNERWTLALEWSSQREFAAQGLRVWEADGKRAGRTRSAKGLTYATIEGAGHLVPYDKPKEALELVNRWIAGKEL